MREVNHITMTELTCTINRDLMAISNIDNDFLYKVWKGR